MKPSEVTLLANSLLNKHIPQLGYTFKFNNNKRRIGFCHYKHKTIGISLPYVLLNPTSDFDETIEDTILHEIAHAMTPGAKHGIVWKIVARTLGAKPKACVYTTERIITPYSYIARCKNPNCMKVYYSNRKKSLMKNGRVMIWKCSSSICSKLQYPSIVVWEKAAAGQSSSSLSPVILAGEKFSEKRENSA